MATRIILILATLSCVVLSRRLSPPSVREIPQTLSPSQDRRDQQQQQQQLDNGNGIPYAASFHRGAVESPPAANVGRLKWNDLEYDDDEFGSRRYPLRDAVEASPAIDAAESGANGPTGDDHAAER